MAGTGRRMSQDEKAQLQVRARELRADRLSYRRIASELGVSFETARQWSASSPSSDGEKLES